MIIEYHEVSLRDTRNGPSVNFCKEKDAFKFHSYNSYDYHSPRPKSIIVYDSMSDFNLNHVKNQALAKLTAVEREALGL